MISRTNNVCHTLVFVMQSGSEEPHGFPSWCVSKCSSNSSSLAIATRFTTVIHERQKYPRFGTASLAFNMRSIAWIVLKRGTSLKLSSCSNRISGYFFKKKNQDLLDARASHLFPCEGPSNMRDAQAKIASSIRGDIDSRAVCHCW